jgi:hypothetical protein
LNPPLFISSKHRGVIVFVSTQKDGKGSAVRVGPIMSIPRNFVFESRQVSA